jgi:hypothetical protein
MRVVDQIALFAEFSGAYHAANLYFDDPLYDLWADGVILTESWMFKDLLDSYALFYDFDYTESGDGLIFFRPVNAAAFTVDEVLGEGDVIDDGSNSGEGCVLTTRADPSGIPILMTVSYLDRTQQYQLSIQRARRQQFPQPTVLNGTQQSFTIPVVVTANEAMAGATRALYKLAHEQLTHQFVLPPNFMALEPGSIIQLNIRGKTYITKLTYCEVQPDLSLKCIATNIAYGPDYTRDGFGGGITTVVVARVIRIGGWVNQSSVHNMLTATFP